MNWTEISLEINADDIDKAAAIANMTVPYGIYIEDYRNLEEETWEIANIDLIDEELLKKGGFYHKLYKGLYPHIYSRRRKSERGGFVSQREAESGKYTQ